MAGRRGAGLAFAVFLADLDGANPRISAAELAEIFRPFLAAFFFAVAFLGALAAVFLAAFLGAADFAVFLAAFFAVFLLAATVNSAG